MAHIKELFFYQRLLYKRTLQADQAKKTEKVFVAWLLIVVFIRFLANTGFAVSTLLDGKVSVGIPLTEFNLFHLLLLWILIPPVITGILGGKGFLVSLCSHFPLSKKEIFLSALYGILFQPVFWILGCISLIGLVPICFIKMNIFWWLCTGIFFICFCMTLSIFLSYLFIMIPARLKVSGIFSPLFKIALFILLFANFSFYWGGDVVVIMFNKSFILYSPEGGRSILSVLAFLRPSTYLPISSPATSFFLQPVIIMAIFLFFSVMWIFFSFLISHNLSSAPIGDPTGDKKKTLFRFIPDLKKIIKRNCTSLLTKELKSLLSTIEVKISICIILIFSIYLIQTPEINQVFFVFFIAVIIILHSSFFFNSFGLDNIVADRYRIFPVTPKAIFTAKNRAILFILSVELFPLLLLNLILSQHILLIGYYCLIILSMILVYCLVGNITSVLLAGPRRYSHFGDNKASGSGRIFLATSCWVITLYLHDLLKGDLIRGIFFYACVCMVLFIAFFALKEKIGLLFEERKEELRKKLL